MNALHWSAHCSLRTTPQSTQSKFASREISASQVTGDAGNLRFEVLRKPIKEMFTKTQLSFSSYDTAWVAMCSSPCSSHLPCFPQCLNWILENQQPSGSWQPQYHPKLIKEALSSTLACVLALKKWGVGEIIMDKGIQFIDSNMEMLIDEKQHSPVGFNVIFLGMVEHAESLGLYLPLSDSTLNTLMHTRNVELQRCHRGTSAGSKAYMAYISEGLGKFQNWENTMSFQQRNGSLFNSPSATAAAAIHLHNIRCIDYLHLVLERVGSAVPTTYPVELYYRLQVIDSLEKLGIARHFKNEIKSALDEIHMAWIYGDEEVHLDPTTSGMAFRILRLNGYELSSESIRFAKKEIFFNTLAAHLKDVGAVIQLYKASEILTSQQEVSLDKLKWWSYYFLKDQLSNCTVDADDLQKEIAEEVAYILKFPYHCNLQRLESRRHIESCTLNNFRVLKATHWYSNAPIAEMLKLAVQDFRMSQLHYEQELEYLQRWIKVNRLDKLKFARMKLTYCYFSAAATLFPPEYSDARISWAKNGVLTTIVDDFFDIGGSSEELVNLIQLIQRWNDNSAYRCCTEQVDIIFHAISNLITEHGSRAFAWQGRCVIPHLVEIWLSLLKSMKREADWKRDQIVPSMEDYLANAYVSFALGPIILSSIYFIGPKITADFVNSLEYHKLFKLTSTCGRLLNDIQSFEREKEEGKLNVVALYMKHGREGLNQEQAVMDLQDAVERNRLELLRLVLQEEGSLIPRSCKDLFWNMIKILHLFYQRNDGFSSSSEMVDAVNEVIHKPLRLPSFMDASN